MSARTRRAEELAQKCENGATQLTYEADHAAEVLADRAGGDRIDPQQWAARQHAAATAAREYAAELRHDAAAGPNALLTPERLAQAEKVASAAELGGILIDGRALAERNVHSDRLFDDGHERKLWDDGKHPTQMKAHEIEATGKFTHVAETINGVKQVPFWQLGHTDQAIRERVDAETGGHRFEPFEGHRGDEDDGADEF